MLAASQVKESLCSIKTFVPRSAVVPVVLQEKLKKLSVDNFKWVVDSLDLRKQGIPHYLKWTHSGLVHQLRHYLAHFLETDLMDWNSDYSHLDIYDTSQPTRWNIKI